MKCDLDSVKMILMQLFPDFKDEVTEITNSDDIPDWDSMNHLNLMMMVQDHFNVNFDFTDIICINSIGDIINTVNSKIIDETNN